MNRIVQKFLFAIGVSVVLVYGSGCYLSDTFAEVSSSSNNQAAVIASAAKQNSISARELLAAPLHGIGGPPPGIPAGRRRTTAASIEGEAR